MHNFSRGSSFSRGNSDRGRGGFRGGEAGRQGFSSDRRGQRGMPDRGGRGGASRSFDRGGRGNSANSLLSKRPTF